MDGVADRLAAAKLWLISSGATRGVDAPRDLPYLSTALYVLVAVPTGEVATIRADEYWRVYVNPDWVVATEVPELARELAHLTWHLLMDHAGRARGVGVDRTTAAHWHRAADLTVAETLGPDAPSRLSVDADAVHRDHPCCAGDCPPRSTTPPCRGCRSAGPRSPSSTARRTAARRSTA